MDLLVISGFLGSGKTTLLLEVARQLSASGRRVAVIENEVGKIGIDNQFLTENGLNVREIFSGCICCSLRVDLIHTLLDLERTESPEVVILEPSGVAGPKQVIQSLYGYGGDIECKIVLSVIDAARFVKIVDYTIPLIADGIEIADAVVLNKVDLIASGQIDYLEHRIRQIRGDVPILRACGHTGLNVDAVCELVISKLTTRQTVESKTVITNAQLAQGPVPVVIANSKKIPSQSALTLGQNLSTLAEHIAAEAKHKGCELIGHIKLIAKNEGGYLFAGKTDFDTPAGVKGKLAPAGGDIQMTVNAIVYGIAPSAMEKIVEDALESIQCP